MLIVVLLFGGCANQNNDKIITKGFPLKSYIELDSLNVPLNSNIQYFPFNEFIIYDKNSIGNYKDDTLMCKLYSQALYKHKEPILSYKYIGKDMYRFFLGHERFIRIVNDIDSLTVIIKGVNYSNNSKPLVYKSECFRIQHAYWDTLSRLSEKALLWNSPDDLTLKDVTVSEYFLEGHRKTGYGFLGPSRISEKLNYDELMKVRELFYKIELLKPSKK